VRGGRAKIQARLDARYAKTREIQDRVDRLSRKMRSGGRRDLSAKERAFAEEVGRIRDLVALPGEEGHGRRDDDDGDDDSRMAGSDDEHVARGNVQARFDDVRQMYAKLREQAETVQRDLEARAADGGGDGAGRPGTSTGSLRGGRFRQRKMMEVEGLLERETALINAVTERLERLQMEAR
jgi:nucleoporin NUP82